MAAVGADELAGVLLRRARRRREWSQAELARRAGVPASQLCAYETGAKQPGVATLARILEIAGAGLGLTDSRAERYRQAQELADVLAFVDAMPPSPSREAPPTFRQLLAS
ncbi:MAG TPA: helix-turn-helix transcriptional regulator [Mycobacteriales bacterium]|nr:helix-turn-helix transcriptional regulator [Mycobacteriales bacterium]